MAKIIAYTTLSFHGQNLARAGKVFDSKDLPTDILDEWVERGLCSPAPRKAPKRKAASANRKQADTQLKEGKDGSDG